MKEIRILRIDPDKRVIAAMRLRAGRNAAREVKRVLKAKRAGNRELLSVDGTPLMVAGGLDVDEAMRGWRLKGGEDTAGIGILYGLDAHKLMIDCPVDIEWLKKRIVWLDGEDVDRRQERAEAILPSLPPEVRAALIAAVDGGPLAGSPEGNSMWIPIEHQAAFTAVLNLGLGDEVTKGQRLTRLGEAVRDLIIAEGAAI